MQKLLSQKQVAHMLGVSVRTLERHRLSGTGPHFVRIGRLVRYREADVDEWVRRSLRGSTSEIPKSLTETHALILKSA